MRGINADRQRIPDLPPWLIRSGRDTDGPAIIALIWSCWSAYPGIHMDVDREMPELHALATYYSNQKGALWVAEADGRVVGMIAVRRHDHSTAEICRVYVDPAWHGSFLGHDLLNRAEAYVIEAGIERFVLWSDTRFERAHRFYEKRSYVRRGPIRVLNDISNSLEFCYGKPANGVEALDIAAARSAAPRLTGILAACMDDDASASFLAPDEATAFWHRAAADVGAEQRVIVAAWRKGIMSGVGMLDLATPQNQRHRAQVENVLVEPSARRTGLGRKIMHALEYAARAKGRSLLTLAAQSASAADALFDAEGWRQAGQIPDYFHRPDGTAKAVTFFWKRVA